MAADNCKGCRESAKMPQDAVRRLLDRMERSGNVPLVSEEEYERRLFACRQCEALQDGSTCRHCGCFVEVRAKLADYGCPYPYAPRWA